MYYLQSQKWGSEPERQPTPCHGEQETERGRRLGEAASVVQAQVYVIVFKGDREKQSTNLGWQC